METITDTPSVCLVFDSSNRILVRENAHNQLEPGSPAADVKQYSLLDAAIGGARTDITCALTDQSSSNDDFRSIHQLETQDASGDAILSDTFRSVLKLIQAHLHRVPYLDLNENEYIYRFRTAKERNRSVYVDKQSDALYQSALCAAIKAARRTKEKTSGEPAVLDFGPVSYVIPSHFGFCLGVQNAIERAYETVASHPDKRVFMLSELIHNPFVNEDLLARGLRYLQTDRGLALRDDGEIATDPEDPRVLWNQLSGDDIVIIPAFGATNEDKIRLMRRGLSIRENDATCMLVEKVWKAARRYAQEGFTVLIHGKSEHEETKATFSNSSSYGPALMIRNMAHAEKLGAIIQAKASDKKALFESAFKGLYSKDFDPLRDLERIAVVNQTTLLRNETLRIIEYLRAVIAEKHGEAKVADHLWLKGKGDTLCYATQVNQDALQKAVDQPIDVALVVGGKNSSNTYQLYRVCQQRFKDNSHYIQSESDILSMQQIQHFIFPYNPSETPEQCEEIRPFLDSSRPKHRILLTGGASCPDGIIQQVIHRINSFFPAESIRPIEAILEAFESDG